MKQERFLLAVLFIAMILFGAWYLAGGSNGHRPLAHLRLPDFRLPDLVSVVDPDEQALNDFKNTADADFVNHCVGATGNVRWQLLTEEHPANSNVRLVQADLQKSNGKSLTIQWHYNLETKVADVSYIGDPTTEASTTNLHEAADLMFFLRYAVSRHGDGERTIRRRRSKQRRHAVTSLAQDNSATLASQS